MSKKAYIRNKDDALIEPQFVKDYAEFALQMNFLHIIALLEKARSLSDPINRKSICLSALQILYSSYEDLAILLQAFRNKLKGKHLHLTIGVEGQGRKGSTEMPKIFKQFKSASQMLNSFGFTSLTYDKLAKYCDITEEELENEYREIADSIKGLGEYQKNTNDYKNRLKHGKPVIESIKERPAPDHVIFLRWDEKNNQPVLEYHFLNASLEQLEIAIIQVAKIYIFSLQALWLFMLHYYSAHADNFLNESFLRCSEECIKQVRELGLSSQGLTYFKKST